MFDFEDLEADAPSPDEEEAKRAAADAIALGLGADEWRRRRDACREIVTRGLGPHAAHLRPKLRSLADGDEDYEVRTAARQALNA
eukprot:CAMPEP_0170317184 /NCGR_PEP_ID=MMETSP0116_2-20130129/59255_1 /TAXON_ID=400756 /ORGANISM="Durinskia baltica, Strain CSIRO CS-38" /LENGTH=84 /DNA_ID=CAMNT_0010569813 /DNA_START=42 /DNA_END=293 /DNA_ORIENTATION=+